MAYTVQTWINLTFPIILIKQSQNTHSTFFVWSPLVYASISHYIVLVIQILLHANQHLFYIYKGLWTHYIRPHTHTPPPHIWDSKDSRSWDCNHIQCHCNYTLMCCTVQIVYSEFKYYLISKYERNNVIDAIFLILQTAILEKLSERTICVFQKSLKNIVYMCSVYIYRAAV